MEQPPFTGANDASRDTLGDLARVFGERVDALDRQGAVNAVLEAVDRGDVSVPDLYVGLLSPYLASIGARWQHGAERVWQEHFASHIVRTVVEALYPRVMAEAANLPRRGETVLLVCPPDEEHELGLRMLSDRFDLAGYRTVFLGADVPIAEIISAGSAVNADLVALSVSTVFERVRLRCYIDSIREGLPGARLLLGGPAFSREPGEWADDGLLDPAELGLPGRMPASR